MEEITIMFIPIAVIFTLLSLYYSKLKIISGMISILLWFPLRAVMATEPSPTNVFSIVPLGFGLFMFFWVGVLIVEGVTGRIIIGKEESTGGR